MEAVRDFEDTLSLLAEHGVHYLIAIKSAIDHPRHQEDARVLELVRERLRDG